MLNLIIGIVFILVAIVLIVYVAIKIYMLGASHATIADAVHLGLTKEEVAKMALSLSKEFGKVSKNNDDNNNGSGKNPLF